MIAMVQLMLNMQKEQQAKPLEDSVKAQRLAVIYFDNLCLSRAPYNFF
jgi:hypothetical protein